MLQGHIVDPETGKVVAVIRHGEVFRDDKEGKIATVLNDNLYDLSGNLVGRLDGQNVIDVRTWTMPAAFRNLLAGESAHLVLCQTNTAARKPPLSLGGAMARPTYGQRCARLRLRTQS